MKPLTALTSTPEHVQVIPMMKNLFDGFGSDRVDEAGWRPVQDDGVNGAERFEEDGLLCVRLAVSVLQLAVPLLLRRVVIG